MDEEKGSGEGRGDDGVGRRDEVGRRWRKWEEGGEMNERGGGWPPRPCGGGVGRGGAGPHGALQLGLGQVARRPRASPSGTLALVACR